MKFSKLLKRYQELLVDAIKMFANGGNMKRAGIRGTELSNRYEL